MEKFTRSQVTFLALAVMLSVAAGAITLRILDAITVPDQGIKTEKYTVEQAANIMSAFLDTTTPRKKLATEHGFSGDFPVAFFDSAANCKLRNCGIALWFCQDPDTKEFFLALEPDLKIYNKLDIPPFPSSKILFKPKSPFRFPSTSSVGQSHLKNFLLNDNRQPLDTVGIGKTTVDNCIKQFESTWKAESKYNFSFFAENVNLDLKDCVAKAGPGGFIRYYVGYEPQHPSGQNMSNKFRIILVAVNNKGEPQIAETKDSGDDGIIQSSWPPPPFN